MLIARAPVRISLAGGGTDLPAYYNQFGGVVINTTIDKYFYVFLRVYDGDSLQIASSDYSTFYRQNPNLEPDDSDAPIEGTLKLPRTVLNHFGVARGLSMFLASEIPPGTGLGSSSTVTVAIIKALSTAIGEPLTKGDLAELACHIEMEQMAMPIGKQDQYAAAYGGLNEITFSASGCTVKPLDVSWDTRQQLQDNLMLFFTGHSRNSADILREQTHASRKSSSSTVEALHRVKAMVEDVRACFVGGDLTAFGQLLHENWMQKKLFAPGISNALIDDSYDTARKLGAVGGKITGAGGGGFLMLYCPRASQPAVTDALEAKGLLRMDYKFDSTGARVLMNAGLSIQPAMLRPSSGWNGAENRRSASAPARSAPLRGVGRGDHAPTLASEAAS
ncbi:MAG: GHMP kinase [Anaerolineae bacterium]|nr:GHMP kinase [Anaerolineae bacterium]MCB0240442.1 GHMP kinase [Anaerolineae bacterium]MCB0248650.1 GHMP kinase [Anaerolineae bacterium]MCB9133729.1 GHMP kinase [Anaerolineales bacterium]MCO5247121.1 GHMP kinase [Anaerolineae bacterium]